MKGNIGYGDRAEATFVGNKRIGGGVAFRGRYKADCYRRNTTQLKWSDTFDNEVFAAGLQHVLDVVFAGDTQVTTWYVGLIDDSPTFSSDDVSSAHAGWDEVTDYSGDRKAWSDGRTNQTVDNSSNQATFTMDADGTTVGGAGLWSGSTGTTAPILAFSGAAFSGGDKTADSGDKIVVTYTLVATDDTSS